MIALLLVLAAASPAERVDDVFARFDSTSCPGCAVAVARNGRVVLERGYGMADLERGQRIRPATIFGLASLSKTFVAQAAALLAEDGSLDLDRSVRRYVPELPEHAEPVTVRMLVHQTSGFRDYLSVTALALGDPEAPIATSDALALIGRQHRLNAPAGSRYAYSNTNYFLLGEIVARVANRPLREVLRERVFAPLGMRTARLALDGERPPGQAASYRRNDAGVRERVENGGELRGEGGIHASVLDLMRWEGNHWSPVLGRDPRAHLARSRERGSLADGAPIPYGWGLQFGDYRGAATEAHGGTWAGYRAYFLRIPEHGFAAAVLCNDLGISPFQLTRRLADVYLEDVLAPATEPPPPPVTPSDENEPRTPVPVARRAEFLGRYACEEFGVAYVVTADSSGLRIGAGGVRTVPLTWEGEDSLRFFSAVLTAHREGGAVSGFTLDAGRVQGVELVRDPAARPGAAATPPGGRNPARGGRTLEVPPMRGEFRMDGRLDESFWADAAKESLAGGGEVRVCGDDANVYVGIRGPERGWAHVYLAAGDSIRVLHASAALGTAAYRRDGEHWRRTRGFRWELRAPREGRTPPADREAFFAREGWVANTATEGNALEFRIARDAVRTADARLIFLQATAAESPRYWPRDLADDALDRLLVRGNPPDSLRFAPAEWGRAR